MVGGGLLLGRQDDGSDGQALGRSRWLGGVQEFRLQPVQGLVQPGPQERQHFLSQGQGQDFIRFQKGLLEPEPFVEAVGPVPFIEIDRKPHLLQGCQIAKDAAAGHPQLLGQAFHGAVLVPVQEIDDFQKTVKFPFHCSHQISSF